MFGNGHFPSKYRVLIWLQFENPPRNVSGEFQPPLFNHSHVFVLLGFPANTFVVDFQTATTSFPRLPVRNDNLDKL